MHISIIDDEKILANKIGKKLEQNGYTVSIFYGYREFLRNGNSNSQLYIVDISLQDGSGFDIVNWLRGKEKSHIPIIIISGFGDSQNIIYGLDIGADDYLTKPFVPEELMARVKAVLRRPEITVDTAKTLKHKKLTYDTDSKIARFHDKIIHTTRIEARILECFLLNKGKIVSRSKLIVEAWGQNAQMDVTDNTINVTLSKIRKKFPDNFELKTIYNQGYLLK